MKAIIISNFGGPETLRLEDRPDPAPGAGEALVGVDAIGVGYVDVMARQGRYVAFPEPGFIPGLEIAGRVTAVGAGVDGDWVGKRVFGMPMRGGGYADLVVLPVSQLIPLPDALSSQDAVALGMNALVAKVGMERASIGSGEEVFVRGAGGGIGIMAVQVAAARGAKVTATTSSEARGARLRALGATTIVDRREAAAASLGDFDMIVDTIGGLDLGTYVAHLKPNGRYVMCGGIEGLPKSDFGMDILGIFHRSPLFLAFSLNSVEPGPIVRAGTELFAEAQSGLINPVIDREMPLADAAAAHDAVENGEVFGKIVLIP